MTGANRAASAQDELARARACLEEAKLLRANGYPFGTASRAYYVVFHAARALLFLMGIETKTHRAVASLVSEHYVKTGRLSSEMGRLLSRMQRDREDADYATGAVFTDREATQMIGDAEAFLHAAERLATGA